MPANKSAALRRRFGLSALDTAPVVFLPTQSGKVWGGMGNASEDFAEALDADQARAQFVEWLSNAYPGLVPAMLEALGVDEQIAAEGLSGNEPSLFDKLIGAVTTLAPAYLQYDQQKEILAMQLDRAREGLPPLNTGQYAPSVQIGLDQDTIARMADEARQRAAAAGSAAFGSPLTWLALAGGGFLLWNLSKGKSGRSRRRA